LHVAEGGGLSVLGKAEGNWLLVVTH
jgi:hypothetical protein